MSTTTSTLGFTITANGDIEPTEGRTADQALELATAWVRTLPKHPQHVDHDECSGCCGFDAFECVGSTTQGENAILRNHECGVFKTDFAAQTAARAAMAGIVEGGSTVTDRWHWEPVAGDSAHANVYDQNRLLVAEAIRAPDADMMAEAPHAVDLVARLNTIIHDEELAGHFPHALMIEVDDLVTKLTIDPHDARDPEDEPPVTDAEIDAFDAGTRAARTLLARMNARADALEALEAVSIARYTCDGETFTAVEYTEDNDGDTLDPRVLALKVGEKVSIDMGAGIVCEFARIDDAKLTKFTIELEVEGDPSEAQDVIEMTLETGTFQDEINEGGTEEYKLRVTNAALVGVASVAAPPTPAEESDNRDLRLAQELETTYPKHGAWTFEYMYPGNFSYYREGDDLRVFFTPDWDEKGKLCCQATTGKGFDLDVPVLDEAYPEPLTADFMFEAAKKLMDHFDGLKTACSSCAGGKLGFAPGSVCPHCGRDVEDAAPHIAVEAGSASKTDTGVERGVDVTFTLTLGGKKHDGEVTLLPHADGRPGYGRWGSVDNWLDGRTVALLRADDRTWNDALDAIESACAAVADAFEQEVSS